MIKNNKKNIIKSVVFGGLGTISLFSIYFFILSWANSIQHAWQQFILLWPWMSALIIGFGIQVGIFTYMHQYKKKIKSINGTTAVATTGGVSAGSMVACCLHHVTDVLPILGLSAATIFLIKYQTFFLGLGVVSNLVGVTFMFHTMQKHNLFFQNGLMEKIMKLNMKRLFIITIFAGSVVLILQIIITIT